MSVCRDEIHRTKAELLKWVRPGAKAWVAALLKLNGSHTANLGVFLYEHQMIRKSITLTAAAGLSLSNITDLGIRPTPEYLHLWTLFPLKAERTC